MVNTVGINITLRYVKKEFVETMNANLDIPNHAKTNKNVDLIE